jgi:hypothetical protein
MLNFANQGLAFLSLILLSWQYRAGKSKLTSGIEARPGSVTNGKWQ